MNKAVERVLDIVGGLALLILLGLVGYSLFLFFLRPWALW